MSSLVSNEADRPAKKARTDENGDEEHQLNALEQLKKFTTVVADSGDFASIKQFSPQDATTNPSLILKAAQQPAYRSLIQEAVDYAKKEGSGLSEQQRLDLAMDRLAVNFGAEISKVVPGYVSTEVDARLSFHTGETVARAQRIIKMYEALGISRDRILIKVAATYEGINAGRELEAQGIHCNLTLLFCLPQAALCAEHKITLISPFVGRILDWHKAKHNRAHYEAEEDPGVLSVRSIFAYFKKFGYKTIVMGASFRNKEEVLALAGCDRLTIAPALLEELRQHQGAVHCALKGDEAAASYAGDKLDVSEAAFRFQLNEDAMATEKLSEGIRLFSADIRKLEEMVRQMM